MLAQCREPGLASVSCRFDCKPKTASKLDALMFAAAQTGLQEIQAAKPLVLPLLFPGSVCLVYKYNKLWDTSALASLTVTYLLVSGSMKVITHIATGDIRNIILKPSFFQIFRNRAAASTIIGTCTVVFVLTCNKIQCWQAHTFPPPTGLSAPAALISTDNTDKA